MPRTKTYSGGCLCGKIRFEAQGPALKPHTCSCKMCQRHSGALTTAWVEFPRDAVKWSTKPATWRSSAITSRAFCPTCGSTLGAIDDAPTVGLMLGVFDKPNAKELMPTAHSYKGGRPKWWCVRTQPQSDTASQQIEIAEEILRKDRRLLRKFGK